jgi:hypothetical protein
MQMALSVVLLIGAGLLIRSFARLAEVDPGFNASHVITFKVDSARIEMQHRSVADGFFLSSWSTGLAACPVCAL